MRVQDLRDNEWEIKNNLFNKRGWFDTWRWQLVISKNPLKLYGLIKFNLETSDKRFSGFILGLLGTTLYFNIENNEDSERSDYGFYTDETALVITWNKNHWSDAGFIKFLYYPWSLDYCHSEYIDINGNWTVSSIPRLGTEWKKENKKYETFDYTYVLKNGTVQNRKAKVSVERRTWWQRWWGLGKKRITPKKVRTSIDVEFDGEVGERTGSWKGGTIGCGYDLLPNETPEQCLRRMEKEMKF